MKGLFRLVEGFFRHRASQAREAKKATGAALWHHEKKQGKTPRCAVCGKELRSPEESYFRRLGCCELGLVCAKHANSHQAETAPNLSSNSE
ncbi:hypothetical protein G4V39_06670 [Thermosulfuriphilus ammonigenes]|uniref:Uncharacterized protein n=1 Tax=Thermosulfuriphilus ammonigenes TaxID=1936021 RepID=A0A6G7PWN6_9BACT|nr:hypothetical protein [Thermosulfuriphilus ammonigenes]QIJ71966.1 hypothetical protein G4V39_06670 [Thermosulfuriphilus ammonigenes]